MAGPRAAHARALNPSFFERLKAADRVIQARKGVEEIVRSRSAIDRYRTPHSHNGLSSMLGEAMHCLCETLAARTIVSSWRIAELRDFVAFRQSPEQLIRFLRANNIPVESLLRLSEVHARVQAMIDNLYW